ncbi:hypothetical protein [Roseobacter sinensis]|uniref:Uncharacterized protein n=1 Tax=Roseobacter sinensis TaxID=2931391 RepID=A0ABT3BC76_9RHOB|nr:hypothetical protein [Roseobacter sp. WL0113]MCV3271171.1 hypothetical protein [Roseobacter sp. WL0113]
MATRARNFSHFANGAYRLNGLTLNERDVRAVIAEHGANHDSLHDEFLKLCLPQPKTQFDDGLKSIDTFPKTAMKDKFLLDVLAPPHTPGNVLKIVFKPPLNKCY